VSGLFERGSRSTSTILLLAALGLVFFSQKGSFGPVRSTATDTNKKDDEDIVDKNGATILYSRVLGKAEKRPEKEVAEAIAEEKPETKVKVLFSRIVKKAVEDEKPYNVLYSRSLGKAAKRPEKRVAETVVEEKPETKTQVLFSRIIGKAVEEKKPLNVLYSRSLETKKIKKAGGQV